MKHIYISLAFLLVSTSVNAQFVWNNRSSEFSLPEGIRVFTGHQNSPTYLLHYIEFDMTNPNYILHPYWSSSYRTTSSFSGSVGAIAAINGGFFSASSSVSSMIEPGGVVKSQSIQLLNRDGINYPVGRAFFGILPDKSMRIDWVYHFSSSIQDFYRYDNVFANSMGSPAPSPTKEAGILYNDVLMGLAGGPNLVSNGQINVTYDQEVFFGGSGLDGSSNRARSAIGYTADGKVIMLVAETGAVLPGGNFVFSNGATLNQLAQFMIDLGCIEAMNLDGGGSSTLAIGNTLYSRPSGGTFQRPVPTIFAIVPIDSLKMPAAPLEEVVIDSEMDGVTFDGTICTGLCANGWFQTANLNDSYGGTGSWLSEKGDGSRTITFAPTLKTTQYEVFGWWSASSNRTLDTPFVIIHRDGRDTVRMNQTLQNAQWVSLGTYEFTGTPNDRVIASNAAKNGTYVVADAIRFVQKRAVTSIRESEPSKPSSSQLNQNYPNPFNPSTVIGFQLSATGTVDLRVFDTLGREVKTILSNERMESGEYTVRFDGAGLTSGTYIYRLTVDGVSTTRMMTLVR